MVKVKICGITHYEDAIRAGEYGADELGFNFYVHSRRYIHPRGAREIADQFGRSGIIGVFVNEPLDRLLEIAEVVGLDGIQLHGDEDAEYVRNLKRMTEKTVVKALRVRPGFVIASSLEWPSDFTLFDSHSGQQFGGTGEAFDWKHFGDDIKRHFPNNAYLAGGLNPENVVEAVRAIRPYAVDVASGVESAPGRKDPKKLEAFITNAKQA